MHSSHDVFFWCAEILATWGVRAWASACAHLQGVQDERVAPKQEKCVALPRTLQVAWYLYEVGYLLWSAGNHDDVVQIAVVVLQPGLKLHCVNHFRLDVLQLDQGNITDLVVLNWPR